MLWKERVLQSNKLYLFKRNRKMLLDFDGVSLLKCYCNFTTQYCMSGRRRYSLPWITGHLSQHNTRNGASVAAKKEKKKTQLKKRTDGNPIIICLIVLDSLLGKPTSVVLTLPTTEHLLSSNIAICKKHHTAHPCFVHHTHIPLLILNVYFSIPLKLHVCLQHPVLASSEASLGRKPALLSFGQAPRLIFYFKTPVNGLRHSSDDIHGEQKNSLQLK